MVNHSADISARNMLWIPGTNIVNHPAITSARNTLWIPGTNRATASMDLLAKQILYWLIVKPILLDCWPGYIYFPVRQGVEDMPGLEADI
jgi:hypothetical protein